MGFGSLLYLIALARIGASKTATLIFDFARIQPGHGLSFSEREDYPPARTGCRTLHHRRVVGIDMSHISRASEHHTVRFFLCNIG